MLRQAREFCIHAKTRLREYNFVLCKFYFSIILEFEPVTLRFFEITRV